MLGGGGGISGFRLEECGWGGCWVEGFEFRIESEAV